MEAATQVSSAQEVISKMDNTFEQYRTSYQKNPYPSYQQRVDLISRLKKCLVENEKDIYHALSLDYGYRSDFDSFISDFLPTILGVKYTLKNLKKWMKPEKRHHGLALFPSNLKVHYQPLGVVGVIVPWNFPLYLSFGPMLAALAAGNRVMVKMSEFTPKTAELLTQILSPFSDHIQLFNGGVEVSSHFSKLNFDHLLFTGSTQVGKYIAQAAAEKLTPVTLELGGKSPVVIDHDVNLKRAVESILNGKILNSGQICVAPDYILLPQKMIKEFISVFGESYQKMKSSNKNIAQTQIINNQHVQRLQGYIDDAVEKGAAIHYLDESRRGKDFAPVLLSEVHDDMKIMQEEIFGSLLPVIGYEDIDQAIQFITSRPRPLALYIMSKNSKFIKKILNKTHSGGVSINDTIAHVAADDAPFGGVGQSGYGQYHGIEGFKTFSHARTVLGSPSWLPRNYLLLYHKAFAFKLFRKLFIK